MMKNCFFVLITVIMAALEIAEPTVINCNIWLYIETTSEIWNTRIVVWPNSIHSKHPFLNASIGMFQRLDKLRKNAFSSVCLFGENHNSTISGIWIWRGHDLVFELSDGKLFLITLKCSVSKFFHKKRDIYIWQIIFFRLENWLFFIRLDKTWFRCRRNQGTCWSIFQVGGHR